MGENKETKLTIELVPETCWYSNVRSEVSKEDWDIIRKDVYKKAGYKCEICGGVGPKWPVECHEIWDYSDDDLIQKLTGMIALCPDCHTVKHPGLANIKGRGHVVIEQLMEVNEWEYWVAQNYVKAAFDVWEKRSKKQWILDISYLQEYLDK